MFSEIPKPLEIEEVNRQEESENIFHNLPVGNYDKFTLSNLMLNSGYSTIEDYFEGDGYGAFHGTVQDHMLDYYNKKFKFLGVANIIVKNWEKFLELFLFKYYYDMNRYLWQQENHDVASYEDYDIQYDNPSWNLINNERLILDEFCTIVSMCKCKDVQVPKDFHLLVQSLLPKLIIKRTNYEEEPNIDEPFLDDWYVSIDGDSLKDSQFQKEIEALPFDIKTISRKAKKMFEEGFEQNLEELNIFKKELYEYLEEIFYGNRGRNGEIETEEVKRLKAMLDALLAQINHRGPDPKSTRYTGLERFRSDNLRGQIMLLELKIKAAMKNTQDKHTDQPKEKLKEIIKKHIKSLKTPIFDIYQINEILGNEANYEILQKYSGYKDKYKWYSHREKPLTYKQIICWISNEIDTIDPSTTFPKWLKDNILESISGYELNIPGEYKEPTISISLPKLKKEDLGVFEYPPEMIGDAHRFYIPEFFVQYPDCDCYKVSDLSRGGYSDGSNNLFYPNSKTFSNVDIKWDNHEIMKISPSTIVYSMPEITRGGKSLTVTPPLDYTQSYYFPDYMNDNRGLLLQKLKVLEDTVLPIPQGYLLHHFDSTDEDVRLKATHVGKQNQILGIEVLKNTEEPAIIAIYYSKINAHQAIDRLDYKTIPNNSLAHLSWQKLGFGKNQQLLSKLQDLETQKSTLNTLQMVDLIKDIVRGLKIPYAYNEAEIVDNFVEDINTSLDCALASKGGICNDMARICYGIAAKLGLKVVFQGCIIPSGQGVATNKDRHVFLRVWIPESGVWYDWETTELNDKTIKVEPQVSEEVSQSLTIPNAVDPINYFANKKVEGVLFDSDKLGGLDRFYHMLYPFIYGNNAKVKNAELKEVIKYALSTPFVDEPKSKSVTPFQRILTDQNSRNFVSSVYATLNFARLDQATGKYHQISEQDYSESQFNIGRVINILNSIPVTRLSKKRLKDLNQIKEVLEFLKI